MVNCKWTIISKEARNTVPELGDTAASTFIIDEGTE